MASWLYRTTRPLYLQVTGVLHRLGVASTGSPTTAALIALDVTGLLLLDARPTQTRLARLLPGRCHDALNPAAAHHAVVDAGAAGPAGCLDPADQPIG